jgi:hypothetical protein
LKDKAIIKGKIVGYTGRLDLKETTEKPELHKGISNISKMKARAKNNRKMVVSPCNRTKISFEGLVVSPRKRLGPFSLPLW